MSSAAFAAPTNVWTGASNGLWSIAANWQGNVKPVSGNNLVFPSGITRTTTTNNLLAVTINQIRFQASNYRVEGQPVLLSGGIFSSQTAAGTNSISAISLQNNQTITNYLSSDTLSISNINFNGFSLRVASSRDIVMDHLVGPSSGLTKAGTGRLSLSGTQTITNIPIVVTQGIFSVSANLVSSPVELRGGLLIASGNLPAFNPIAGTISPGPSLQTLRTGNLKLNSKITLEMEVIGGDSDHLSVTGLVDIGSATLKLTNSLPSVGTYTLIDNNGTDPVVGTFANLPEGAVFTNFPTVYRITYAGGKGNDVVLTALSNIVLLSRGPYLQNATTGGVTVCWRTSYPSKSHVRFGTDLQHLDTVVSDGTASTNHFMKLSGLVPGAKYFYSIGNTEIDFAGGTPNYFILPPGTPKPFRLWAIGDAGTGQSTQFGVRDAYYQFAGTNHTDVWLMLGDNAYSSGTEADYQKNCFNVYTNAFRNTLLWSTIGNHETYGGGVTFPYFDIFDLPTAGEGGGVPSGTEHYYSFDYANVHFICLDAMTSNTSSNGPMCTWLKSDLEAATKDWVIAFWHHPPYTKGTHDSDSERELIAMRENAVPILESYGVDLVLCGHSHVYERSFLLRGHYGHSSTFMNTMKIDGGSGRENDTGVYLKDTSSSQANVGAVYVVAGSSGWTGSGPLNHPAMFYSTPNVGSFIADINGLRLDAKFLRDTGLIEDSFTIIKQVGSDVPRIVRIQLAEGQVQLRWSSTMGTSYEVQESTSLENPSWHSTGAAITATGTSTIWTTPESADPDKMFYRVRKLP
ncbi:MAG: hypothetical protein JWM16_3012 [Verrucomicrobiales bacterium]|nr:hypothetical protein [Verrucomicrobiales bacterium]